MTDIFRIAFIMSGFWNLIDSINTYIATIYQRYTQQWDIVQLKRKNGVRFEEYADIYSRM
jgi:hypothetical protein